MALLLSQCALPRANDILPCTGKCVNDIMPEKLPCAIGIMQYAHDELLLEATRFLIYM